MPAAPVPVDAALDFTSKLAARLPAVDLIVSVAILFSDPVILPKGTPSGLAVTCPPDDGSGPADVVGSKSGWLMAPGWCLGQGFNPKVPAGSGSIAPGGSRGTMTAPVTLYTAW